MDKTYRKLIENIKIDGEKLVDKEMATVYAEQKIALDNIHAKIGTLYINYGNNGLIKFVTTNQRKNIQSNFENALKNMAKELGGNEVDKITEILMEVYKDTYYKNAFVMDQGLKTSFKFGILKKEFIDAAVNAKYKGEFFSDRIWTSKATMIDKLQSSLTEAMKGTKTIDQVARDIKNTFNTTAYESQRLVQTENARVQTQASYDIGISSGVEQVMWSATLDNKTAEEDADLDGKVWGINEDHPEPPLHPSCRCCLINMPYEGWTPTQRKDNENKDLIDNTTYAEWLKNRGIKE